MRGGKNEAMIEAVRQGVLLALSNFAPVDQEWFVIAIPKKYLKHVLDMIEDYEFSSTPIDSKMIQLSVKID